MIERDQPRELPDDQLIISVSSVRDDTMTHRSLPEMPQRVDQNRTAFIEKSHGDIAQTALVCVTYEGDDYCRYRTVDERDLGLNPEIAADGLVTTENSTGIFLPLADCCGTVLYDTAQKILMVSHLGRHSVEQLGGVGSVRHLVEEYETDPRDVYAWLSPAAGGDSYPVHRRANQSLHDLIVRDLQYAGVPYTNIEISEVDTTTNDEYYSHSQYIKGEQDGINGRFAIYARMK